jgi:hypothetical protein
MGGDLYFRRGVGMTRFRHEDDQASQYTPDVDPRASARDVRDDSSMSDAAPRRSMRRDGIRAVHVAIIVFCSIVGGASTAFGALGFRQITPSDALASESQVRAHTDSTLQLQLESNRRVVDSLGHVVSKLEDRLTYGDYLQCEQIRANPSPAISASARRDCDDIIRGRLLR